MLTVSFFGRILKITPHTLESIWPRKIPGLVLYVHIGPRVFTLDTFDGALGIVLFESHKWTFVPVHKLPILDYWYNLIFHESTKAGNYMVFGNWRVKYNYVEYYGQRVDLCRNLDHRFINHDNAAYSDIYLLIALSMTDAESQLW